MKLTFLFIPIWPSNNFGPANQRLAKRETVSFKRIINFIKFVAMWIPIGGTISSETLPRRVSLHRRLALSLGWPGWIIGQSLHFFFPLCFLQDAYPGFKPSNLAWLFCFNFFFDSWDSMKKTDYATQTFTNRFKHVYFAVGFWEYRLYGLWCGFMFASLKQVWFIEGYSPANEWRIGRSRFRKRFLVENHKHRFEKK